MTESAGPEPGDALGSEFAKIARAAQEARLRLDDVLVTVTAPRHLFTISVDGRGRLEDLDFPDDRYRSMPRAELAAVIVETLQNAQDAAVAQAREQVSAVLPVPGTPSDGDGDDRLADGDLTGVLGAMADRMRAAGLPGEILDGYRGGASR